MFNPMQSLTAGINSFAPSVMGAMGQIGAGLQGNADRKTARDIAGMPYENAMQIEQLRQQGSSDRLGALVSMLGSMFGGGQSQPRLGGVHTNYGGGVTFGGRSPQDQARTDSWVQDYRQQNGMGGHPQPSGAPGSSNVGQQQFAQHAPGGSGGMGGASARPNPGMASSGGGMPGSNPLAAISPYLLPQYSRSLLPNPTTTSAGLAAQARHTRR